MHEFWATPPIQAKCSIKLKSYVVKTGLSVSALILNGKEWIIWTPTYQTVYKNNREFDHTSQMNIEQVIELKSLDW